MDLVKGLVLSIEIQWGDRILVQEVDYWKIPFRCSLCKQTRHLKKLFNEAESDGRKFILEGIKETFREGFLF